MPSGLRDRIAAELKIDLKVVSVSVSGRRSEETRYSKLQLVTAFLEENAAIGSVDAPEGVFQRASPDALGSLRVSGLGDGVLRRDREGDGRRSRRVEAARERRHRRGGGAHRDA